MEAHGGRALGPAPGGGTAARGGGPHGPGRRVAGRGRPQLISGVPARDRRRDGGARARRRADRVLPCGGEALHRLGRPPGAASLVAARAPVDLVPPAAGEVEDPPRDRPRTPGPHGGHKPWGFDEGPFRERRRRARRPALRERDLRGGPRAPVRSACVPLGMGGGKDVGLAYARRGRRPRIRGGRAIARRDQAPAGAGAPGGSGPPSSPSGVACRPCRPRSRRSLRREPSSSTPTCARSDPAPGRDGACAGAIPAADARGSSTAWSRRCRR